ncbi:hypothetical protein EMPS_10041 [Entomortierella parvispora]|uniref:Uncharacterized protein n=1 Tax=Entomortierella parvispora TaxID=205924 RepID=A0A9P3HJA6_9FUNG|nr:hypothetical protein EMPS_10041 [Entomortierella parvispora]
MTMQTSVILKVALWFQAALLLVLTSTLADTDAWIGAIVTGVGLAFVVVGIIAAHKQHIGSLYIYATLVGVWEILALAHILMICGLIALPRTTQIDLTAVVIGKRVAESKSDPLRIVLPVLYGLQWSLWCLALVCLVSLRLVAQDPTLGFEIQDPKQQQQQQPQQQQRPHSIESTRSQHWQQYRVSLDGVSHSNGGHRQHLLNFRQSVISPMGGPAATGATHSSMRSSVISGGGDGAVTANYPYTHQGKKSVPTRFSTDSKVIKMPTRSYEMAERRASSESNAVYIPSDPRISQVVVTFKNVLTDPLPSGTSSQDPLQLLKKTPESTTVFITNHNYAQAGSDRSLPSTAGSGKGNMNEAYVLNFASSGESLSDMIFKQTQTVGGQYQFESISKCMPGSSSAASAPISAPEPSTTQTSATSSVLPATTESIFNQLPEDNDTPNPARIRATATKASLTLSSDSSSSELSSISSSTTTSLGSDSGSLSQEGVVAGLAMVSVTPLNVTSKDKDQRNSSHLQDDQSTEDRCLPEPVIDTDSSASDAPHDSSPGMQPNSSESSHSLSSILSSSSLPQLDEPTPHPSTSSTPSAPTYVFHPVPSSTTKPIISAPASSSNEPFPVLSPPAHILSHATPSVTITPTSAIPRPISAFTKSKPSLASIPFQYWRNRAAAAVSSPSSHRYGADSPPVSSTAPSSFSQSYLGQTSGLFSKKKKFQIPTIVIHPDEEDGEPPRVLSQKDIEYLSTMPPAPMRPLIQPWEEEYFEDGGGYDDAVNEGYDYDETFHPHHSMSMQGATIGYQQGLVLDSVQEEEGEEEYANPIYGNDEELAEVDRHEDFGLGQIHPHHHRRRDAFGGHGALEPIGCDPYALDVPIDLDVDLQSLQEVHQKSSQDRYPYRPA